MHATSTDHRQRVDRRRTVRRKPSLLVKTICVLIAFAGFLVFGAYHPERADDSCQIVR